MSISLQRHIANVWHFASLGREPSAEALDLVPVSARGYVRDEATKLARLHEAGQRPNAALHAAKRALPERLAQDGISIATPVRLPMVDSAALEQVLNSRSDELAALIEHIPPVA